MPLPDQKPLPDPASISPCFALPQRKADGNWCHKSRYNNTDTLAAGKSEPGHSYGTFSHDLRCNNGIIIPNVHGFIKVHPGPPLSSCCFPPVIFQRKSVRYMMPQAFPAKRQKSAIGHIIGENLSFFLFFSNYKRNIGFIWRKNYAENFFNQRSTNPHTKIASG